MGQPEFRDCDDSHRHMAVFKVTKQQRLIQNAEQLGRLKQEFNEYRCTRAPVLADVCVRAHVLPCEFGMAKIMHQGSRG